MTDLQSRLLRRHPRVIPNPAKGEESVLVSSLIQVRRFLTATRFEMTNPTKQFEMTDKATRLEMANQTTRFEMIKKYRRLKP